MTVQPSHSHSAESALAQVDEAPSQVPMAVNEAHAAQVQADDASSQDENRCMICYEDTQERYLLPCTHWTCPTCAERWVERRRACPFCRCPLGFPERELVDHFFSDSEHFPDGLIWDSNDEYLWNLPDLPEEFSDTSSIFSYVSDGLSREIEHYRRGRLIDRRDSRVPPVVCEVCMRPFRDRIALAQHKRDTRHDCFCWCGRQCATPQAMLMHKRATGHGEQRFDLGLAMSAPVPRPQGQSYTCDICRREFGSHRALLQHQQATRHRWPARHDWICWCGRSFASPGALSRHTYDTGHDFGPEYQLQNDAFSGDDDDLYDELQTNRVQDFEEDLSGSILSESSEVSQHVVGRDTVTGRNSMAPRLNMNNVEQPRRVTRQDLGLAFDGRDQHHSCRLCNRSFGTLHSLRQHLRATGHAVYTRDGVEGSASEQ